MTKHRLESDDRPRIFTQNPRPIMNAPTTLTCEYLTDPIGIDDFEPRLSWRVGGPCQNAYQITVGSDAGADDVWDSGKVVSDQSLHVVYGGPAPESKQRYHWRVRTWDDADTESSWSEAAFWEMGLKDNDEWQAQWVGDTEDTPSGCPVLRKTFSFNGTARRARLYIAARGVYEATVNGNHVTGDVLGSGFTDVRKRIQYRTFDVTDSIEAGENTIEASIGGGWYSGRVACGKFGKRPWLIARLEIEADDSTVTAVVSDDTWQVGEGPRQHAELYDGEIYDARVAPGGWHAPAAEPIGDVPLVAHRAEPVRRVSEVRPVSVTELADGTAVFDLGQNIVGWCRLKVSGAAGTKVTLRHAEILDKDGKMYYANLRGAKATDEYTLAGNGVEEWEPRFTFHGFRYVAVSGLEETPDKDTVTGVVVYNDMALTGEFECNHDLINKLQSNIQWGQRGNFIEVPTDCPQRDERQGWTGDAQVFAGTACFNMNVAAFYTKWMIDVADAQREDGNFTDTVPDMYDCFNSAGWTDAGVIVPWNVYLYFGDRRILERHYDAMSRFIQYMKDASTDFVARPGAYGDWLHHDAHTPFDLIATAYFAHSTQLMAKIAGVLGRDGDVTRFNDLFERVKDSFNRHFVTPSGRVVGDSQTAYVLALHFDLLPESALPGAVSHLEWDIREGRSADWPYHRRLNHLSTGFLGTRDLTHVLSSHGHVALAYKLLQVEDYPSWLFPVVEGATTIWERWDGWHPEKGFQKESMNSFNHYAYGAIGQWLYQVVAGLQADPDEPGYKHSIIRPIPLLGSGIDRARASLETLYGRLESSWHIDSDRFILNIVVPPNTRATVTMPDGKTSEAAPGEHEYTCSTDALEQAPVEEE